MRLYLQLGHWDFRSTCLLQIQVSIRSSSQNIRGAGDRALYKVPGRSTCCLCFQESVYFAGCCQSPLLVLHGDCSSENNQECLRVAFVFCLLPCVVTWIVPNGNLSWFSWTGQIFFLLLTWSSYCECSWGYIPRSPLWCMGIPPVQLNLEIFVMWVLNLCRNKLGTRL